ncbi:MAG: AAA family ATPase [Gammaproteobacteria bacterium]|nr:AAA family ATPase [Gammaproteobacteria bacterium]
MLCEPVITMSSLSDLIQALQNPQVWPHPAPEMEVVETHISYVLLVGDFAYKFKKAVNLGFLDFTTLELRQRYCEQELRLNRRLAPDLYLDVIVVTGSIAQPVIAGAGPVVEYAVKMRRFPSGRLLSQQVKRLSPELMDRLASHVSVFHAGIALSDLAGLCGSPESVYAPMLENFRLIRELEHESLVTAQLDRLQQWTEHAYADLKGSIAARKAEGFVRECHGDMHLGNITLIDDELAIFDGIEFDRNLRWIDTISDIAFLVMDLEQRGRSELAQRFLNSYLERCGDYDGLELLSLYKSYRALVRAKVAAIRLGQDDVSREARSVLTRDLHNYLDLAESYTRVGKPAVVITHGLSGSGKSFSARLLAMWLPAVQIRSDVERKRLTGLSPEADSYSQPQQELYSERSTENTYNRLLNLAENLVAYGLIPIVDATFLKREQRKLFAQMAEHMLVPFIILDMQVIESVLRERVRARIEQDSDVSEADEGILEMQLQMAESLTGEELAAAVVVTEEQPLSIAGIRGLIDKP